MLLRISVCRQSCRQCIELHGESAERGRESPFCVLFMLYTLRLALSLCMRSRFFCLLTTT